MLISLAGGVRHHAMAVLRFAGAQHEALTDERDTKISSFLQ